MAGRATGAAAAGVGRHVQCAALLHPAAACNAQFRAAEEAIQRLAHLHHRIRPHARCAHLLLRFMCILQSLPDTTSRTSCTVMPEGYTWCRAGAVALAGCTVTGGFNLQYRRQTCGPHQGTSMKHAITDLIGAAPRRVFLACGIGVTRYLVIRHSPPCHLRSTTIIVPAGVTCWGDSRQSNQGIE